MSRFIQTLQRIFSLSTLSLSLMRIILGLSMAANFVLVVYNYNAFVGSNSLFPPSVVRSDYPHQTTLSFHSLIDNSQYQILLFIIHALLILLFIIGYKTKYITPLLRLFTCSLQGSQYLLYYGGDLIERMILFRSIFLPLSDHLSIDSIHQKNTNSQVHSIASIGFTVQIALMYLQSVILKNNPIRNSEFSALQYALGVDYYTSSMGKYLRSQVEISRIISALVYLAEWIFPLCILSPRVRIKKLGIIGLVGFHLGLVIFMDLGPFPWFCIAGLTGLYPSSTNNISKQKIRGSVRLFLIICTSYIILQNIQGAFPSSNILSSKIMKFGDLIHINQSRSMYAPYPSIINGRHEINGIYYGGNQVNIISPDQSPFQHKPSFHDIKTIAPNIKRAGFLLSLNKDSFSSYRPYLAQYLCKNWNNAHHLADHLKSIEIIFHRELSGTGNNYISSGNQNRGTWDCK